MFGLFQSKHKVFLPLSRMTLEHDSNGLLVKLDLETQQWLVDYRGKYEVKFDSNTGARWIEFRDKELAVLCKLTLG